MSRRYAIRDRDILRWVMNHPGTGAPYSVRTLAEASHCTRGLIDGLLTGRQKTASVDDAHSIAEAVGVALLVLFMPSPSPERDNSSTEDHRAEGTP